ncbi:NmrA/HSCARG family protein [Halobacteria archaeon AArc-m2/3/4]|uniref:NmrA/HSCARG family protein n=1 Tax=Natronoglomus mannanivorans TaxID=2979990 RepID=A0AAP3E254_9EURY|nr:NmrA/HSCARG family protein [Halobacteria archaeon AArc-xg1-1]MCU4972018.1 NmrA/HSCARG family protein [Halobacteria archaeon AArc-m2/3/4]
MTADTVLVVGSTGTQGGAVARNLLERDVEVLALTRDTDKPEAHQLAERGAEIVEGDISEKNAIEPLIENADGVFCVTNFWEHGYEDEVEQGTNVAELAAEVGVDHFVFSSVGGAERDTGISHFDSKWEIEERIRDLELPATVVRPVFFMQNLEGFRESIEEGTLAMGLEPREPLQMLDIDNMGAFVANAFQDPDRYLDEAYELASDELTLRSMAVRFADALGTEVRAQNLSIDDVEEHQGEEYADMFAWFNDYGYESPIADLQADHHVVFSRLEEYLAREWSGT